jgi:glucoamylase
MPFARRLPPVRAVTGALAAVAALLAAPALAHADGQAPGAPGERHTWAPADKHGFGSSADGRSRVWFTLRSAELSEVYYPDLSTPSLRDLEFVVTDGRSFTDRETGEGVTSSVRAVPGSLTFVQTTSTPRWRITKTWIADARRDAVLADVRFRSLTGRRLALYVLVDPAPGDDGNDDRARTRDTDLVAWDDASASAVAASPPLRRSTSGYLGTPGDPWTMLRDDGVLTARNVALVPGNVVQAARTSLTGLPGSRSLRLAVGFGTRPNAARSTAHAALEPQWSAAAGRYAAGWAHYLRSLKDPPASVKGDEHRRRLYEQSLMVLAASEDKANRGASIASPTMPWVWGTLTLEGNQFSGPYHLVWPRDLYHVATAQKAAGDDAAAGRLLDYLWRVQKPDGSWWQNTRVNGRENWTSLQLDEVALPVVLAWWLGRTSTSDWEHVRMAADFIADTGPQSPQERWENQNGWSPNTIATEIAGLICAADVATRHGDDARATRYRALADEWQAKVEDWTATTTGPYSDDPYYLRLTKDADPDDGSTYPLGDNRVQPVDEREIVDQSFLGLVLFGAKPHDDPTVLNSLAVGDRILEGETPHGPIWHRFTFDGYGETDTGADWDIFPTAANQTHGRLWPLLAGERGEYELLAGHSAAPFLQTIAGTANDGLMLPEQVWDGRPPTGEDGQEAGEGTRSATPLAWTHGAYIRLAWSIDAGTPVERPSIVACRYVEEGC